MASNYLEVELRKHLFRTGTFAKPTTLYVALYTTDPTDADVGVEVSGGGYARVQLDPGDANWTGASSTDGITTNAVDITYPAPTGAWGVVTHFGVRDAVSGGNLLVAAQLAAPRTISSGQPAPLFPAGSLQVTFT